MNFNWKFKLFLMQKNDVDQLISVAKLTSFYISVAGHAAHKIYKYTTLCRLQPFVGVRDWWENYEAAL